MEVDTTETIWNVKVQKCCKVERKCTFVSVCTFLLDQGPLGGGHRLPLSGLWTFCDPLHRFQSQGSSLTCTLTCLCLGNLRVMSCHISAFFTNRGVNYVCVYTADSLSRHPSCKQRRVGSRLLTWVIVRFNICPSFIAINQDTVSRNYDLLGTMS